MTTVRHVSKCCSLCYSFSFSHMSRPSWFEFTTAILRVVHISLRSLHLMQYVRLLLFYSVIFQSCKFQSCKFSYPVQTSSLVLYQGRVHTYVHGDAECQSKISQDKNVLPRGGAIFTEKNARRLPGTVSELKPASVLRNMYNKLRHTPKL